MTKYLNKFSIAAILGVFGLLLVTATVSADDEEGEIGDAAVVYNVCRTDDGGATYYFVPDVPEAELRDSDITGVASAADCPAPQQQEETTETEAPPPAVDSDGDGLSDDNDACPNEAPTTDADGDGCEDPVVEQGPVDSDGDGFNDDADDCPSDAETYNDYEDGDGCPDSVPETDQRNGAPPPPADSDGDGVNDDADACPSEAPTTDADGDGCEDQAAAAAGLEGDIVIQQTANFFVDIDFEDDNPASVTVSLTCSGTGGPPPPSVTPSSTTGSESSDAGFEVTGDEGNENCTASVSGLPTGYSVADNGCASPAVDVDESPCTILIEADPVDICHWDEENQTYQFINNGVRSEHDDHELDIIGISRQDCGDLNEEERKIWICHRTNSDQNPFNAIFVPVGQTDGADSPPASDHGDHLEDIIPITDVNGDEEITDEDCLIVGGFTGTILVCKETTPTPNADVDFEFDGDLGDFTINPSEADCLEFGGVPIGTYSIDEDPPDGWDIIDVTCSEDANENDNTGSVRVDLDDDDEVTCTWTNDETDVGGECVVQDAAVAGFGTLDAICGTIIVCKDAGGADQPFSFEGTLGDFTLNDGSVDTQCETFDELTPSTDYDITEDDIPTGWVLTDISCDSDGDSTFEYGNGGFDDEFDEGDDTAVVSLAEDDIVTCTFTNEEDQVGGDCITREAVAGFGATTVPFCGFITICKFFDTDGSTAGLEASFATDFILGAGADFALSHQECHPGPQQAVELAPGDYFAREILDLLPDGFVFDHIECSIEGEGGSTFEITDNRVDISLDEDDLVICTFFNEEEDTPPPPGDDDDDADDDDDGTPPTIQRPPRQSDVGGVRQPGQPGVGTGDGSYRVPFTAGDDEGGSMALPVLAFLGVTAVLTVAFSQWQYSRRGQRL